MTLAFVLGESIVHFDYAIWLLFAVAILVALIVIISKFKFKLLMVIFFSIISGIFAMNKQLDSMEIKEEILYSKTISYSGEINNKIFKNEKFYYYIDDILVLSEKDEKLKIGNYVNVIGEFKEFSNKRNPGCFDEKTYYNSLGIKYKIISSNIEVKDDSYNHFREFLFKVKGDLKTTIYKVAQQKEASVFAGIILGESSEIDKQTKDLYRGSGVAHILAISGLHISMIGFGVYKLLRRFFLFIPSSVIAGVIIFSFVLMTGESASGVRALIMFLTMLLAEILGRTYDILSAISLAAIFLLVQNPMLIYNTGFLLSFSAVFSIAILLPVFEKCFDLKNKVLKAICVSLVATLGTAPIIADTFFQLPTYTVFINLIILPFVGIIMGSGIIATIVGSVYINGGAFLVGAGVFFLKFNEVVCNLFLLIPFSNIVVGDVSSIKIFAYYLLLSMMVILCEKFKKRNSVILVVVMVICVSLIYIKVPGNLEITIIDVGQGDGILINNQDRDIFMIDGGSSSQEELGKYTLLPFFKSEAISEIDYWFITHCDLDHLSGLVDILSNYNNNNIIIQNIVIADLNDLTQQDQELLNLAQNCDINIIKIKKGDVLKSGEMTLSCLHPYVGYESESANANGYSIVLSLDYKEFEMLFTGDLEDDGEKIIVSQNELIDYDMVKIAHHGSKTSTSEEFLNRIKPEYSIISCGINNSYGHPHSELLERLESIGTEIFTTAKSGAIQINTDGYDYNISGFLDREEAE